MPPQKTCLDCGTPINPRATRCWTCAAQLHRKQPVLPGVDKFHKLCPKCGAIMYRYANVCRACSGFAKLPSDVKKEHEQQTSKKNYQTHRDDRLRRNKEYYNQNAESLRQYRNNYYQEHVDEIKVKAKQTRLANPEQTRAKYREYDQKRSNTPEYKAYQKAYQEKNADRIRLRAAEYRKRNKDLILERHRKYYQTEKGKAYFMRMRKRHTDSQLLKENKYQLLWLEYRPCDVCGSYERREVDHIIEQSKGGSDDISNLRVLCFKHHRKAGNGRHSTWREGE